MGKNTEKKDKNIKDYAAIFSERLTAVVSKLRWNQTEFGRRLGLSQVMAGRLLAGKTNPTFETLARIEAATRVPVATFFDNEAPLPKPLIESNLPEDVRTAIQEAGAENAELLKQIQGQLGPVLAKLRGDDESVSTTVKAAPRDKFTSFVNELLHANLTANFYRLIDEGAPKETLRTEFLRELVVGLLSEGGKQAKQARKILTELLEIEKGDKG